MKVRDLGTTSFFDEVNNDPFEWPRYQTDIPQPEDRGIVIKDILQGIERHIRRGEEAAQETNTRVLAQ